MNLDDEPHRFEFVAESDEHRTTISDTAVPEELYTKPDAVQFAPFEARVRLDNGNAASEELSAGTCEYRRVVVDIGDGGFVRVSDESCL